MNTNQYHDKVLACWLGKAVGGTLGMPYEGFEGPFSLDYYSPVPDRMIPNDDLDLQIVWACILRDMPTPRVDRDIFVSAWRDNIQFPWDEYGVAKRNLCDGLQPPLCGSFDNWFKNGMGAAIRSEIWACLAPGKPDLAAAYAYEDACLDHAEEGIWAEVLLACMASAAFVETNIDTIVDIGLQHIPENSLLKKALADTRAWWKASGDWLEVRGKILERYGHENFTDVTMNLAFVMLALLAGKGDFGKSICLANNCGKDTDCTAASVGAILGIMNPEGIEDRWLKPIGRQVVLSEEIVGISTPETIDELTELVMDLRQRLGEAYPKPRDTPEPGKDFSIKTIEITVCGVDSPILESGFQTHAPAMPTFAADAKTIVTPGTVVTFRPEDLPSDIANARALLVRYRITLQDRQEVRIFFNTPQNSRVWIDGQYAFGRECGRMSPSAHRIPINQSADLNLDAGVHEMVALVAWPDERTHVEWVTGVADLATMQWLPEALR